MVLIVYAETVKKAPLFGIEGEQKTMINLPPIFNTPLRKDLIKRAFLAEFTAGLQPKGRDPMAGKRTTAESYGVGRGIARVPRLKNNPRAALINFAVGGRLAHPPRVEKKIVEEINKKEKIIATASAIAATSNRELVVQRGHIIELEELPIIIESGVLNEIKKTKSAKDFLAKIGVYNDIVRAADRTRIRAGRGKMRGRKYIVPRSVLFVVDDHRSPFALAVRNLPGVDVATPQQLSVLQLAPGGVPGRLTVYTDSSLEILQKRFEGKIFFR